MTPGEGENRGPGPGKVSSMAKMFETVAEKIKQPPVKPLAQVGLLPRLDRFDDHMPHSGCSRERRKYSLSIDGDVAARVDSWDRRAASQPAGAGGTRCVAMVRRSPRAKSRTSGSRSSDGCRGRFVSKGQISFQHSSGTPDFGDQPTFEDKGGVSLVEVAQEPSQRTPPSVGDATVVPETQPTWVPTELPCEGSFTIATDTLTYVSGRLLGLSLSACSACCIIYTKFILDEDVILALYVAAMVLLAFSMVLFLRLFTPEMVNISYCHGDWIISLRRRGRAPKICSIGDLEGFVETFGYCTPMRSCLWNSAGRVTSRHGTLHLFFGSRTGRRAVSSMTVSLQEPLAFFTKLRDVMFVTNHALTDVTADYVAAFDCVSTVVDADFMNSDDEDWCCERPCTGEPSEVIGQGSELPTSPRVN